MDAVAPSSPQGGIPNPYSYALSKVNATQLSGGSVKIVDSTTFTVRPQDFNPDRVSCKEQVSTTIAAAEVTVEPGAIRYDIPPSVAFNDLNTMTESFTYVQPLGCLSGNLHL